MTSWILPKGVASRSCNINETDIHFLESGTQGPILVLVHGLPFSSYMWRSVMSRLQDKFKCIAPDLFGCGLSINTADDCNLFEQIQIFTEWVLRMAGDQPVYLLGHGFGSVIVHGLCRSLGDKVLAVGFYEGYLNVITSIEQMGLPLHHLHERLTEEDFDQQVLDQNFMIDQFLPMVSEGKLSEHTLDIYRSPFMNRHARELLLHALGQMMDFSPGSLFSQIIDSAHVVYESSKLKKVLFYSMPGMVSGLLGLDDFKKRFPNTVITPVGQAMFLAPELNPESFARGIRGSMNLDG